jgi:hypothetical protein
MICRRLLIDCNTYSWQKTVHLLGASHVFATLKRLAPSEKKVILHFV